MWRSEVPLTGRVVSTISPQGQGQGQTRLSQQGPPGPRRQQADSKGNTQVVSRSVVSNSCLDSKSRSTQEECELGE